MSLNIKEVRRLEDKKILAKELGMGEWESLVKEQEEIAELTGMGFRSIGEEEIEKRLTKFYWNRDTDYGTIAHSTLFSIFSVLAMIGVLTGFGIAWHLIILADGFIAVWICMRINQTSMRQCRLKEWKYDMPYGAFCAVKEARDKGFCDFRVWYPVQSRGLLSLDDPIITAKRDGVSDGMFEIFYWDAGTIYDEVE